MALLGSQPFKNRVWSAGVKLSGINAPAEEFIVDPNLPPLGFDPRFPNSDQIVIPRGRLIGIRADDYTYEGKAILTVADGINVKASGFTESNVLRKWPQHDQWTPTLDRQAYIEVPYVIAINDAYGQLKAGMPITAYYGSVTSLTGAPGDKGKVVAWFGERLVAGHQVAATAFPLTAAIYPAFKPTIVQAASGGAIYTGAAATLTWDATNHYWVATFATAVTDCLYVHGQKASQICGEVGRVEPISSTHRLDGWLEWVQDNFTVWEYPPQLLRVPTTDVTNEVPSLISGNNYKLANAPVAPYKPISVKVTGTLIDETGATQTLTATELALADVPMQDYTMGKWYAINPVTGELFINSNVTITSLTVSYSYETSYRDGRLYNAGIWGLTDGQNTGIPGTPVNLDVIGGVGSLRCIIN